MSDTWLDAVAAAGAESLVTIVDRSAGLEAFLAIHSTRLGPAAGGIRTRRYATADAAIGDALELARAMTIKCALGGLAAGGGKLVVREHDGLDRGRAFAIIGQRIEALGGLFRTAGDLGTTSTDLSTVAEHTHWVHTAEADLARAVGRGVVRSIEACVAMHQGITWSRGAMLTGVRVAVQGAGAIGAAVAEALSATGARLVIADVDPARAQAVAQRWDADVVAPQALLASDVDIVSPCAIGGVLDAEAAGALKAWGVAGAANNQLADRDVARRLQDRGILFVPDPVASAGAVIDGIGASVMGLSDRTALIDRIGETAFRVLDTARRDGRTTVEVAESLAAERLAGRTGPA